MPRRWPILISLWLLAACAADPPLPPPISGPACPARQAAVLPVTLAHGLPLVPATINGTSVMLLLDTGAEGSLLTEEGAAHLGLMAEAGSTVPLLGAGGSVNGGSVVLADFALGHIRNRDARVAIGPSFVFPGISPPVVGILGADVLADFDVEFDLPDQRITLYRIRPCTGPVAPVWSGRYDTIPLRRVRESRMVLIAHVDGHAVSALLDTGAEVSVIAHDTAGYLGLGDTVLAQEPSGRGRGLDLRPLTVWQHRFSSLRIGAETEPDPLIDIASVELPDEAMLLGDDWFATRTVWLSYATDRMFVRRN